ncbi:MAG TPA: TAT-variant-translocated molybdopterin oxidoreductase [Bryobacteraceae bacterium]|nr:TAT-variant-translocated molybdopterin oxidoreductase [Bryobacteraceae bacterium]
MSQIEKKYWRSLEELAETEEFRKFVDDEFPNRKPDWNDPQSRRRFLTLMGASAMLAGASSCVVQPKETIVPYVRQPEDFIPGVPLFYATAMTQQGVATGVLVESHLGRPTKIEGNPRHPASLGATDHFTQASILELYDPDRSQTVRRNGYISTWGDFVNAFARQRDLAALKRGAGLRILTGSISSPTLVAQMQEFFAANPEAKWHQWEPCGRHNVLAGSVAAFGKPYNTIYRFDQANVIVSLDADFLCAGMPGGVRYARDYAERRRKAAEDANAKPPRLYVAEGTPSITGGMAEHRFRMRTGEVEAFAASLESGAGEARISAIVKDLQANRGASIVIAGEHQPPRVHAIAHAMNAALGNIGKTVIYTDTVEYAPVDQVASLGELVRDMNSGAVETLVMIGVNPVYDAPADFAFLDALKKVPWRAHVGLWVDETGEWCHWHVPEAHYLESWSDGRAYDGTISLVQPLIAPIYGGKTAHEIFNVLLMRGDQTAYQTVRAYWQKQHPASDFEDFWRTSLHEGVVENTAYRETTPPQAKVPPAPAAAGSGLEVVFRPDPAIGDGRYSNNGWLQEMPKPQNKMTWDNAVWISPASARKYKVEEGSIVEITSNGRKIRGPVWVMPGQADESITVHLGFGRTRAGRVGNGVGFNAYPLRASNAMWTAQAQGFEQKGMLGPIREYAQAGGYKFATTQHTQTMEERDPFRAGTFAEYHSDPRFARPEETIVPDGHSLFPLWEYKQHKWGMSIDLTACVGCQACVVACVAENNIPVVGKEQVSLGRYMHWIRVDRYYSGPLDDPKAINFQPVPCMHCENALCELVCPVAATVHSNEGLNEMVYNRCVGTRYCSNNCPYKVRRFNFLLYSDWYTESLYGVRNPDVTVRSRGVMEKCSYCVQRINRVKIEADKADRPIQDGEILTACQQACPTQAIVFGDLNDPNSRVAKLKKQPRDYGLLEDLDTRPRTTYLARLTNPNPDLEKA